MKGLLIFLVTSIFCVSASYSQVVGLDNWYNHETNAKTGKIFHYTWDDTANSGFSQLGDLFVERGAKLKTITERPDKQSLKGVDIYIIVDPDTTSENPNPNYVEEKDVKFLKDWVKEGGTLLLMANDGPNCEFSHFNKLAQSFGFHFIPKTLNPVLNRKWEMGAETNFPNHPLFEGVKKIYMKEVCPITLTGNAKPVLKDKNDVFIADTNYGKGYVLAVGDPWLYNEYINHKYLPNDFENLKAAKNLVDLLIKKATK